jgi:hypothetical protein
MSILTFPKLDQAIYVMMAKMSHFGLAFVIIIQRRRYMSVHTIPLNNNRKLLLCAP